MRSPFLLTSILYVGVLFGLGRLFDYRLPYVAAVAFFLVLQVIIGAVMWRRTPRAAQRAEQDAAAVWREWPTSGPIGRFGQTGLVITFGISGLLALFNPFQLTEILRQMYGNMMNRRRLSQTETGTSAGPPPLSSVEYALPFHGEWLVYNGGHTPEYSHSWDVITQRYAYDFVMIAPGHWRHEGRGTRVTDYHCYDRDVLAAADGRVVHVRDSIRDAPFVGYGVVDVLARSFIGNHVIIEHGPAEFSFYAHLRAGSLRVRPGDPVRRGQMIGRCGHSGHSSEPHLHFHVQDRADFFAAVGLPVTFRHARVNGAQVVHARIRVGDIVENDGW